MKDRILEINPNAVVEAIHSFYLPEKAQELIKDDYDYIVDAVDTVTAKIDLVVQAHKHSIPIISSMGAGNKLDPTRFQVTDIYKTTVDPLAKVMRRELKQRGVKFLKVVYSTEQPIKPVELEDERVSTCNNNPEGSSDIHDTKKQILGSVSFVPSVAGLIIAGEVIKDLIKLTVKK